MADQFLEQTRQKHLGRLLLEAQRGFSENFLRRTRATNPAAQNISLTHVNMMAHIPLEGIRITNLAARTGMTKQAVGQFVHDLEAEGLIERTTDSSDHRAAMVRFTEKGHQILIDSTATKEAIEREYRELLGDQTFESLQSALVKIIEHEKGA